MRIDTKTIYGLMAKEKMTRDELSRRAAISPATFTNAMQRGACRAETLGKIASALDVDPEELIL